MATLDAVISPPSTRISTPRRKDCSICCAFPRFRPIRPTPAIASAPPNGSSIELQALGFEAVACARRPAIRWSSRHAKRRARTRRMCCFMAITTCSRRIRSSFGRRRLSSRASSTRRTGKQIVGARRRRRQGPADDLRRGLPRLQGQPAACRATSPFCSRARRKPARPRCRTSSPPTRQDSKADLAARLRHRHVGPRDAGDHHHAARPRAGGGRHPWRQPRSAFRHFRRRGAQPDPRARANHRRPARRRGPRHSAGLLRRRRRNCPRTSPRNGAISTSTRRTFWAASACRFRPASRAAACWR